MRKVLGITALVVLVAVSALRAETLQPYRDSAGLFTIFYPKGWRVEKRSRVTAFTPGDGLTFFSILPTIELEGRVAVETLFQSLVVDEFGTLPGYRVLNRRVRPASDASDESSIEATWEWTHPESRTPKRAWILIGAQPVPGAPRTAAGFVMYEAPTREWQRVEPLFKQMLQSLRFGRS